MMKRVFLIAVLLGSIGAWAQEKPYDEGCNTALQNTVTEFNTAFAHTVYFWLRNPENQADREAFVLSLQKFLDHSKYARTCFIGTPPQATREVVDGSFTYSLIVSFASAHDQEMYQQEEAHKTFIEEAGDLWEKVIVYDSHGMNAGPGD